MRRYILLAFLSSFALPVLANDIVILDGRVIDPETGLDAIRNIAVTDNKITAISEFAMEGDTVVNAAGHVVAPGFIDIHAHGMSLPDMRMQAMQGVSTILELESGILPVGDWYADMAKSPKPLNYGAAAAWTYARIATFSDTDPVPSMAYFQDAQGDTDWKQNIADPLQQAHILALIEQGLNEGAIGIGINAGYAPGFGEKEYFALAELAAKHDVATFTHARYASNIEPMGSFDAIKELIANSALTGAHMHICHINSVSLSDIHATLDLVERAQAADINVTVEAYPYGAASTVVAAAMFTGDNWRERMDSTANNFQLGNERMTEDQLADYQANKPGTFITWHFLDEEDPKSLALLDASVTHPATNIASDAVFWSYFDEDGSMQTYTGDEWPLPDNVFTHPRAAGTFAKVLRSYVRERGLISMSDAINKMSLMPAQVLEEFVPQMRKKGRIQVGMDADIVIFDPTTISDRATYVKSNQPAEGVQTLLVNGNFVVRDGALVLDANSGQPIRRALENQ